MTPSATVEVLPPALTKGAARSVETQAKRHWRTATRSACQFAADLRRLQDGQAHIVRGFENFGAYAEHTFDGLSASAAKQLSRQGGVLLVLERHGRIALDGHGDNLPGTTALRRLSAIHGNHGPDGEQAMLAVYDRAAALRPGRSIADTTVKQAEHALMRPPAIEPAAEAPAVDQAEDEQPDYHGDHEPYDPGAIVEDLRTIARDLDDMLAGAGDATPDQRHDIDHELAAIRHRLDRFTHPPL